MIENIIDVLAIFILGVIAGLLIAMMCHPTTTEVNLDRDAIKLGCLKGRTEVFKLVESKYSYTMLECSDIAEDIVERYIK